MDFLKGKRSYLIAAAWGLATFAYANGWLDEHSYQIIQGVLFPAGIASLRAGMK